ncbi:hypothetical protein [Campylobacter sp. FU_497]|nr:hypothetical protein [Campylobacter sp. FU_497]
MKFYTRCLKTFNISLDNINDIFCIRNQSQTNATLILSIKWL